MAQVVKGMFGGKDDPAAGSGDDAGTFSEGRDHSAAHTLNATFSLRLRRLRRRPGAGTRIDIAGDPVRRGVAAGIADGQARAAVHGVVPRVGAAQPSRVPAGDVHNPVHLRHRLRARVGHAQEPEARDGVVDGARPAATAGVRPRWLRWPQGTQRR